MRKLQSTRQRVPTEPTSHQTRSIRVEVGPIVKYAFGVWKRNLPLLACVSLTVTVVNIIFNKVQLNVQDAEGPTMRLFILGFVVQVALSLGQTNVCLKLTRGHKARYGDFFSIGGRFLPCLGIGFLLTIVFTAGFYFFIIPGILLMVTLWPAWYLVADGKSGVASSFRTATLLTRGNRVTSLLLGIISIGILICGFLVFCFGVIIAVPLMHLVFTSAYLMMKGELPPSVQPMAETYYV